MVGILLSDAQVRSAPPAVRAWLQEQVAADFASAAAEPQPAAVPAVPAEERLAACSEAEMAQILQSVSHDSLACRTLLAFGREAAVALHPSPLYALDLAEIIQETGISDGKELVAALNLINAALEAVRGDPRAVLFGFDARGRCFVHEITHRSLHRLRRDLLARPAPHLHSAAVTCDPPYRSVRAADSVDT